MHFCRFKPTYMVNLIKLYSVNSLKRKLYALIKATYHPTFLCYLKVFLKSRMLKVRFEPVILEKRTTVRVYLYLCTCLKDQLTATRLGL